jgi:hypothetical protein
MITGLAKRAGLAQVPGGMVSRRHFITGTASVAGGAAAGELFSSPVMGAPPPTDYDLRAAPDYITSVKDQDSPITCNACTAFAVVASVEGTYNKKNNSSGNQGPDLDEMDLFNNAGTSGGCATSHWWPKLALDYCQTQGLKWQSLPNPRIKTTPVNLLDVNDDVNQTQKNIKDHIFNNGPVIAVMVQYQDFYIFGDYWFQQNNNMPNPNVYSPGTYAPGKHRLPGPIVGGHVVLIVGYNGNKSWICKNSWGTDWNGDGYFLVEQGKPNGIAETYIDRIDVWGVSIV